MPTKRKPRKPRKSRRPVAPPSLAALQKHEREIRAIEDNAQLLHQVLVKMSRISEQFHAVAKEQASTTIGLVAEALGTQIEGAAALVKDVALSLERR